MTTVNLRIAAGSVSSDLSRFPVRIDLSGFPAAFWDDIDAHGAGAVRAKRDNVSVPLDIVECDPVRRDGEAFALVDITGAEDTNISISVVPGASPVPPDDQIGQYAVWSDYDFFLHGADPVDRAGKCTVTMRTAAPNEDMALVQSVTKITSTLFQQGVARDPDGNWYGTGGGNNLRLGKMAPDGTTLLDVPNVTAKYPVLAAAGVNHLSGVIYLEGEVHFFSETYPPSGGNNQHVVVVDPDDFSFIRHHDLSAGAYEVSDVTVGPGGIIFGSDYFNSNYVHKYDPATYAYLGIQMLPRPLGSVQGITYLDGHFYLMSGPNTGSSTLTRVTSDFSKSSLLWRGPAHMQGLGVGPNGELHGGTSVGDAVQFEFVSGPSPGWISMPGNDYVSVSALPQRSVWTAGITHFPSITYKANAGLISVMPPDGGNSTRASLAVGYNAGHYALWSSSDTWLIDPTQPVNATPGVPRRFHMIQNGTTSRNIASDGVVRNTDMGCAVRPTTATVIDANIGSGSRTSEALTGGLTRIYVRGEVLSAEWLAAEQASWEDMTLYTLIADPVATATLTIPAGTVSGAISRFPMRVDFADLPDSMWDAISVHGAGALRAYQNGAGVPLDVVDADLAAHRGEGFVLIDLNSDSSTEITLAVLEGGVELPTGHELGRDSVWADYAEVFVGSSVSRTGSGNDLNLLSADFKPLSVKRRVSGNVNAHQGLAHNPVDGSWVVVDSEVIRRYDSEWNLLNQNTSPLVSAGISGANHISDGCIVDEELWVWATKWPLAGALVEYLAVFNATTLEFSRAYDHASSGSEMSGLGFNALEGLLYGVQYKTEGTTSLLKFDPQDGSFKGSFPLNASLAKAQSVTFDNGIAYVAINSSLGNPSGEAHSIVAIDPGGQLEEVWRGRLEDQLAAVEVTVDGDLYVLWDSAWDETYSYVYEMEKAPSPWLTTANSGAGAYSFVGSGIPTEWILSGTVVAGAIRGNHQTLLALGGRVANQTTYAGLVQRNATPPRYGLWNSTDSWLMDTTVALEGGQRNRFHLVHRDGVERALFRNGTKTAQSTGSISPRPVGPSHIALLSELALGVEDEQDQWGQGNYFYLRYGGLSDDWLEAEQASWEESGFYTLVGAPPPLPTSPAYATVYTESGTREEVLVSGYWDGAEIQPVTLRGLWDGSEVVNLDAQGDG